VFTARLAGGTNQKRMPSGWSVAARGGSKVNVMGGPTAMTADSPSSLSDHPLRTSEYRISVKSREISRDRS